MRHLLLSSAAALAIFAFCGKAHAMGPVDVEAGARLGFGSNPDIGGSNASNGPNPLGFGLGGRAGIAVLGIYGGIAVDYYFGETQNATSPVATASVSEHALKYGAELGYGIKLLDIITIRPQLGIGNFTLYYSSGVAVLGAGASNGNNTSNLYLEPGLVGLVSLGTLFVGADANALILPDFTFGGQTSTDTAFTMHAQIGVKF